jgi:hypothetical protein
MVMAGQLGHVSPDQILQFAANIGSTSSTRFECGPSSVEVFMERGLLSFARQTNLPDGFALGRFLVDRGLIGQPELDQILMAQSSANQPIGARLVAARLIGRGDLMQALEIQTQELVFEVLRWTNGVFTLTANPELPSEAHAAALRLQLQPVLLEGMRRLDEWRQITGEVGNLDAVIERRQPSDEALLLGTLAPTQRMILSHINGQRTIGELVRTVRRPAFDVCKALMALRHQRLVTVRASA